MGSFGSDLRLKRQERGVSLDDISAATRVAVRYYQALEEDDFQALPGGVFNRGIVRGYARVLDLDEQETVSHFMEACRQKGISDTGNSAWGEFAQNVSNQRGGKRRGNWRWLGVVGMIAGVLALAAAVLIYLKHRGIV